MNPKSGKTFVWAAVISVLLGMVVMSPSAESAEKESGIKQVVEMMVNPQVKWIVLSESHREDSVSVPHGKGGVPVSTKFRQDKDAIITTISLVKELDIKWVPVKFDGGSFEYRYEGLESTGIPKGVKAPPNCPYNVIVKGEIISINPPQIKIVAEKRREGWKCIKRRDTSEYIYELRR